MSEHIETLDRPLMGVRQYQVDDEGYLGSLTGRGSRWEPDRPQRAECDTRGWNARGTAHRGPIEPHSAPDPDCGCGYYAWYSATEDPDPITHALAGYVRAVVSAWGVVDLHETGFRAEWMQAEAFIASKVAHKPIGSWVDLMALAERYAVPLIEEEDAEAFCRERGEVLDSRDVQAEHREAKTAQESLSELHKSLQRMAESMVSSRDTWGGSSIMDAKGKTNAGWQAAIERNRNQPAFWRNAAGGEIHNG